MAIKFKRGSAAKRQESTTVLEAGQPFFEKDTNKLYIGDGTTQLKSLSKIEANDGSAAHLSAINTFTGTNVFTNNTLEVNDGKDKGDDGKAVIFSSTNMRIYDGLAGRNYTIDFPGYISGGKGTLALTSDLPDTSSFAKLNEVNKFTKSNYYSKHQIIGNSKSLFITNQTFTQTTPDDATINSGITTEIAPNKISFYPGGAIPFNRYVSSEFADSKVRLFVNTEYNKDDKIYFPETAGTLALTSDIVEFNPSSKYLGTAYCKLTREATMWIVGNSSTGQYGSYTCPGYLVAGYGSGSNTSNTDIVAIGPGGLYKYPSASGKIKFTLPNTAGTLALTKDIPIKTATLSGTTLSITLS